jgi:hypothetical protein
VTRLRAILKHHTWLLALVVLAALAVRSLIPAGYMVDAGPDRLAVSICTAHGPSTMLIEVPSSKGTADPSEDAAKRCAFADLALPGLPAVPPLELLAALAFILALWLAQAAPLRLSQAARLRPPLRGPPSLI